MARRYRRHGGVVCDDFVGAFFGVGRLLVVTTYTYPKVHNRVASQRVDVDASTTLLVIVATSAYFTSDRAEYPEHYANDREDDAQRPKNWNSQNEAQQKKYDSEGNHDVLHCSYQHQRLSLIALTVDARLGKTRLKKSVKQIVRCIPFLELCDRSRREYFENTSAVHGALQRKQSSDRRNKNRRLVAQRRTKEMT